MYRSFVSLVRIRVGLAGGAGVADGRACPDSGCEGTKLSGTCGCRIVRGALFIKKILNIWGASVSTRSGPAGRRLQERRVWSLPVRVFRAFRVRCGVPFFASFERGRNRFHRSDSARRGSDPVVSVLAGGASALRPEPRCQKADRAPYGCRPDKKSRPVVGNPD